MITPELIGHIRGEFAKGRTREEIHAELVADGGWSEADLSEAFRTVIPMQGFTLPNTNTQKNITTSFTKDKTKLKSSWGSLFFIIIGLIGVTFWYFYSPQIINFWNSGVNKITELSTSYFGSETNTETVNKAPQNNSIIKPTVNVVKDCGIGMTPDLKTPLTYQNNDVLTCLGNSALRCEDARAVLKDASLFPNVVQIINTGKDTCNFRLSYGQDSTLTDITGKKLAGQYIMCPIDIVKVMDETQKVPLFRAPSLHNPSKYASEIYFYGILGLFIENNVDKTRIRNLNCNGSFIDSVIASYHKMQNN